MKIRRILSFLLTLTMLLGVIPVVSITADVTPEFIISNPYANVDWGTYGQYKAALHSHTTNSDGTSRTSTMAERHWDLGFHIVSFNDHDYITVTPDTVDTGAMTRARVAEMESGLGRSDSKGMIFIPATNEASSVPFDAIDTVTKRKDGATSHHINTYWTPIGRGSKEQLPSFLGRIAEESTGFAVLNHLGRNTGALLENVSDSEAKKISNAPEIYEPYAEVYMNHPNVLAQEIMNKLDPETRADRILWDNILGLTMPHGRNVWGTSNDDSHHVREVGFSYNLMLMPDLTLSEFRRSFESGAFFAFARVDREYKIFPGAIEEWFWQGRDLSDSQATAVHNLPTLKISKITVDDTACTISINATGYDSIKWYADGVELSNVPGNGATLNLNDYDSYIKSYVRAVVVSKNYGVIYVQPFGIQRESERALPVIESVNKNTFDPVKLMPGAARSDIGSKLPGGTHITTDKGVRTAAILWEDLKNTGYNPVLLRCQTFTINGKVSLTGIANPNEVALGTTISFTIPCTAGVCECQCGDCGICKYCDPCSSCFGVCRRKCSHRNCEKIYRCKTCTYCKRAAQRHDYHWTGDSGEFTGNFNFIFKFDIDVSEKFETVTAVNTDLQIYFPEGSPSNRRLWAWTDLTGTASTTMATESNLNSGRVARTDPRVNTGDKSAKIKVPLSMFYDSGSGKFATKVYILASTDNSNPTQPTESSQGNMRDDLPQLITSMTLSMTGLLNIPLTDSLSISAVSPAEHLIEIHNPTDKVISSKGFYLTIYDNPDNKEETFLLPLPNFIIRPGTKIVIRIGDNKTASDIKRMNTNFTLSDRNRLQLKDATGETLWLFDVRE
ncbi:MAG: hypothetical protein FWG33_04020 [Oscillospiraceae bacterium]|nr:hypothetical protein [Oscillospiraceae bacterium]